MKWSGWMIQALRFWNIELGWRNLSEVGHERQRIVDMLGPSLVTCAGGQENRHLYDHPLTHD